MDIKEINTIVKNIVNKDDPLNLIQMGAPEDEYSLEIGEISLRIVNKVNKEIKEIVKDVFREKFDGETVENYKNRLEIVGEKIKNSINKL